MNERQRVLTWIFVAAIAASIIFAPWEKSLTSPDVGHVSAQEVQAAIWEPPQRNANELFSVQLRTGVIIMEWIAASLIYGASYFALSDKKGKTPLPEQETNQD